MSHKQEHTHHITPVKYYFIAYGALTVLMLLTVAVVYFPFPSSLVNNAINLTIAVIKAVIVIAIFMGVKWSTHLTKMFAMAGFIWLSLMSITFGDYFTRSWEPVQGWYAEDHDGGPALQHNSRSPLSEASSYKTEVEGSGAKPLDQTLEKP